MQRNGILVTQKYMEYLGSTMGFIVSLYLASIVDGILVSQLIGPAAFAGINLTMPVYYARNIVFFLLVDGGSVLAAQYIGARDKAACNQVFTLTIGGGAVIMTVLGVAGGLLVEPLAAMLAGESSLTELVKAYLLPLWLTSPLLLLANGMAAYLRLSGEHKLSIAVPVAANICNLGFDYLFIAVFGWGIGGAGWATGVGYACSLFLLWPYFQREKRDWHFISLREINSVLLRRIMQIGLPMAMIPLGLVVRHFAINSIVIEQIGYIGAILISLCNAGQLYALMFVDGASTALANVCGALYGGGDMTGVRYVLQRALRLTFVICLLVFAGLFFFPLAFMHLYGVNTGLINADFILYFRISLLYVLFLPSVFILRAFFQSTHQEWAATLFSALEGVILVVPLYYLLSYKSLLLMWAAPAAAAALSLVWLYVYLRKKAQEQGWDSFLMLKWEAVNRFWEVSISADIQEVTQVVLAVKDFCRRNKRFGSREAYAAQLTVEELGVVIAEHSGLGKRAQIDILIRLLKERIIITVRDNGRAFNPVKYLAEHGKDFSGISMVRKLAVKMEYTSILGFNTTIVTIGKR
ncbi:MATE family efflux transporter [Selenomonas ruminantium]|uniref:MATE family efflux transporter n=1 Tax=Selenomonas ruminantium TaxID=971 RepID=UPI00040BF14E|nr:MATE family efflux transporter [Selenomonas ruminantium]